jgi:hypothetical protein
MVEHVNSNILEGSPVKLDNALTDAGNDFEGIY